MAECVDTVPPLHDKFTKENTLAGCYASCNNKCGDNDDAFRQCRRACRDLLCAQWDKALARDTGPCAAVQDMCDGTVTPTTVPGTTSTTIAGATSSTVPGTTTSTTVLGMSMAAVGGTCLLGCNDFECSDLPTTTSTSTSSSVTSTSSTSTTIFSAVRRNRGR
jgi:hypothetical protein